MFSFLSKYSSTLSIDFKLFLIISSSIGFCNFVNFNLSQIWEKFFKNNLILILSEFVVILSFCVCEKEGLSNFVALLLLLRFFKVPTESLISDDLSNVNSDFESK